MFATRPIGGVLLFALCGAAAAEPPREEIVVTATRFQAVNPDLPIGVEVIRRDELAQSSARSLPELLARRAGIHTRDSSGAPDTQLDLRGFGVTGNQNMVVLLDGQRLSEIELVSPKWSAIPLAAIERIEIMRGGGAVLYGGGATGGVVNIVTRDPKATSAYVGAALGSYATRELKAGFSGAGALKFGVHANHYEADNYRANNAVQQRNIEADLRGEIGGGQWWLKLGADDQKLRLPGARTEAQLSSDRRGTSTPLNHSTRRGEHFDAGFAMPFGAHEARIDVGYRERVASAFFAPGFSLNTDVDKRSVAPRLKIAHGLLGKSSLVVGLDWEDWDYASVTTFGATRAEQTQRAVYAQNTTELRPTTRLALGARAQQSRVKVGADSQTRSPSAWELALSEQLTAQTRVYGRVGRSFRIATVDENVFQPTLLEPQTAIDKELGLVFENRGWNARAALYRIDLKNEIAFIPSAPPFGNNINLPPTRRQGIELEARWHALPALDLSANYTYAQAEFRSGTVGGVNLAGNEVPLVPKHSAGIGALWRIGPKTRLAADLQYVGSQRYDNDQANTFGRKMPAYTIADFKLTHEIDRWLLAASIKNAFNERYYSYGIASGTTFSAYPAALRSVLVSAEYRF